MVIAVEAGVGSGKLGSVGFSPAGFEDSVEAVNSVDGLTLPSSFKSPGSFEAAVAV